MLVPACLQTAIFQDPDERTRMSQGFWTLLNQQFVLWMIRKICNQRLGSDFCPPTDSLTMRVALERQFTHRYSACSFSQQNSGLLALYIMHLRYCIHVCHLYLQLLWIMLTKRGALGFHTKKCFNCQSCTSGSHTSFIECSIDPPPDKGNTGCTVLLYDWLSMIDSRWWEPLVTQIFFMFTPIWGRFPPNSTCAYFSDGLVQPTRICLGHSTTMSPLTLVLSRWHPHIDFHRAPASKRDLEKEEVWDPWEKSNGVRRGGWREKWSISCCR